MSNNKKLLGETIKTDVAFVSSALVSTKTTPVFLSMRDYQKIAAIVVCHLPAEKVLTLQLRQATTAAGTTVKNLGSLVTITNGAQARDVIGRVEARADSLDSDDGYTYVGLIADTDSATNGAGIFIRSEGIFRDGIAETGLSDVGVTTTTVEATTTGE